LATFDEFYASLDPDVGIRGKQFEKFVKWFLKTDPTWASQIDEVWLWNDYPKRWGADCGIDLIFTHKNGKTWAVQSKCVSPNNDIKKSEIDSFLSESSDSKIDGRLLIASTDGIGKNAQQVIHRQEKQVVCFLLDQFRQSEIAFPSSMEDLRTGQKKEKKKPDPRHQIEAIKAVSEGLKNTDRGQVLMACGTGKTLTSLWIKEKIKAEQVLVFVPSLSLLSQTLKVWNAEANESFKWICVCSDKSVAKDKSEDQWISNTSAIGVPVTNKPLEIKNFLDESGSKVIFSTYQSSQLIVDAQEHHDTSEFDLVIADEAHRCAGKVSDAFGAVLDANKIKGSKRLFFTATPRILSKQIKTKSLEMDFEVASMDDHSLFGEVLYELKFSEAIKKDLLTDYQVVVIGVDDEMIKQKIVNRELIKVDDEMITDAEMIASQIAIAKAIKEYDLRRIITFHSRIKNAKVFNKTFDAVIRHIDKLDLPSGQIISDHISGFMKTIERNKKLLEFKNLDFNQRRILTNAKCLSEGVDIPTLSGIGIINPKQSQIDIIQAVGRAIRKSREKTKGIIVIPLYISEEESLDEAILLSNFKKVWQIVLALKSQDDLLMDCINKMRVELGENGRINSVQDGLEKIIFDIPQRITSKFTQSIQTLLVKNSSEDWFQNYGQLKKFHESEGHSLIPRSLNYSLAIWCVAQRKSYKEEKLSQEKINLLEKINFSWDPDDDRWNKNYKEIKKFYDDHGHSFISLNKSEPSLFYWTQTQRTLYKKNKLSKERIQLLEEIKFIWNPSENQWYEIYYKLKEFYIQNGYSFPSQHGEHKQLGLWCNRQRQYFKKNKLSQKQISLLEEMNFPWDPDDYKWHLKFSELKQYYEKEGHSSPKDNESNLGKWCSGQRRQYFKNKLSKQRIELLESINFKWDLTEYIWKNNYEELKKFYEKEGHSLLPQSFNKLLGQWCTRQRKFYKEEKLSQEKINLLEQLNFIWDPEDYQWKKKYEELKKFYDKEGHSLPTQTFDKQLSQWCLRQRKSYNEGKLSQNKIDLLKQINFVWNYEDYQWNQNYEELKKFYEKEGHSTPNKNFSKKLSTWIIFQRKLYREEKLSQEKINLLEQLNFIWDPEDYQWNQVYEEMKKFYEKEGHSNPYASQNARLSSWKLNQKNFYKKGKLSQERIHKLQELKFKWNEEKI